MLKLTSKQEKFAQCIADGRTQKQLNRIETKLDLILQALLEVDEDDMESLVDLNGNRYGGTRDDTQPL